MADSHHFLATFSSKFRCLAPPMKMLRAGNKSKFIKKFGILKFHSIFGITMTQMFILNAYKQA